MLVSLAYGGRAIRFVYAFGTGDDLGVRSARFRFAGV
jgi:hypothetical protein